MNSLITCTEGAWSAVEEFLREQPDGSELIWVTFSLRPTEDLMELLQKKRFQVTFVCRHPDLADPGQLLFSVRAWDSIQEQLPKQAVCLGLRDVAASDGEQALGPLHAKLIAVRSPWGGKLDVLSGSFNCTVGSLQRYTEQATRGSREDAEAAWAWASDLAELAEELTREECNDLEGQSPAQEPGFDSPPAAVQTATVLKAAPPPPKLTHYSPEIVRFMAEALDEMLQSWPKGSAAAGYQWDNYERLRERAQKVDVLYLPVGVGKTFVALRWLMHQLAGAQDGKAALFLVPNKWVQSTVRKDVDVVIQRARELADAEGVQLPKPASADFPLHVLTPSQTPADHEWAAAALDEVHNWNPVARPTVRRSYTSVVTELRDAGHVPLLGLSATPCRMDHGRFSVPYFLRVFLGEDFDEVSSLEPTMKLQEAVDKKLLARPRFVPLGQREEEIREVLSSDGMAIRWGDYSQATLRRVWDLLANERGSYRPLISEVLDKILAEKRKRIVVFVPPVEEAADAFVEGLQKAIHAEGGSCVDFRSRVATGGGASRGVFQAFRDEARQPAVIVTVDRLGEGVSVPDVDCLVMLRATLSPRIAVQALGRGLRLAPGKKDCLVLDAVLFEERLKKWELVDSQQDSSASSHRDSGEDDFDDASLEPMLESIYATYDPDGEWVQALNPLEVVHASVEDVRADPESFARRLGVSEEFLQGALYRKRDTTSLFQLDDFSPAFGFLREVWERIEALGEEKIKGVRAQHDSADEELSLIFQGTPEFPTRKKLSNVPGWPDFPPLAYVHWYLRNYGDG